MGRDDISINPGIKPAILVLPYRTDAEFSRSDPAVVMTENTRDVFVLERMIEHGLLYHGFPLFFINLDQIVFRILDKVNKPSCSLKLQHRDSVLFQPVDIHLLVLHA